MGLALESFSVWVMPYLLRSASRFHWLVFFAWLCIVDLELHTAVGWSGFWGTLLNVTTGSEHLIASDDGCVDLTVGQMLSLLSKNPTEWSVCTVLSPTDLWNIHFLLGNSFLSIMRKFHWWTTQITMIAIKMIGDVIYVYIFCIDTCTMKR